MVRHTLQGLGPKVLATRMVRDYVDQLYTPAAASSRGSAADGYAAAQAAGGLARQGARRLAGGQRPTRRVDRRRRHPGARRNAGAAGRGRPGRAEPDDVDVQAAYGRVDETDGLHDVQTVPLAYAGDGDGLDRCEGTVPLERTGAFGYTVRVLPKNSLLATEAELGVVTVAS